MSKLILVRHGQSEWNLANRFTGWWDVDLTEKGEAEAREAGELMKAKGVLPTTAFTSLQKRAIKTLNIALEACDRLWIPQTREKHGDEQVHVWRRSFDVPPPEMEAGSEFDLAADPRYAGIDVPRTESLKLTIERVLPYWKEAILPLLGKGETGIISAHGNSLRALVKHLSAISDDEITGLEIPTGQPIVYEFEGTKVSGERYYLKDS